MFNKLKQLFIEPKIYSIVLSSKHGRVLHLGVHFSLEEALDAAKIAIHDLNPTPGAPIHDPTVRLHMWASLRGQEAVSALLQNQVEIPPQAPLPTQTAQPNTSPIEVIKHFKESKNQFMQSLINKASTEEVKSAKELLSNEEYTFIMKKIHANPPHKDEGTGGATTS